MRSGGAVASTAARNGCNEASAPRERGTSRCEHAFAGTDPRGGIADPVRPARRREALETQQRPPQSRHGEGVDAVSRARREAIDEAQHHPGLHLVVDGLRAQLGAAATISWQDNDIARVSTGGLDFVLSRVDDTIVINHSVPGNGRMKGENKYVMSTDVATHIIEFMHRLARALSDSSKPRKG
jgi:hypothetical protein